MARSRMRQHYHHRTTTTPPKTTSDPACGELRQISLDIRDKVDLLQVQAHVMGAQEEPRTHNQREGTDRPATRLYRKISGPLRKAGRRLREMEAVKAEFDGVARGIEALVEGATEDMDRRYSSR